MKSVCISHLYQDQESKQWIIQENAEHQRGVADMAESFASKFSMGTWGRALGLLHDKGKESHGFQAHIKRESGYDPSAHSSESHQHAYAGAVIAQRLLPREKALICNPLAGHHRGLYDFGELKDYLRTLPLHKSQIIIDSTQ